MVKYEIKILLNNFVKISQSLGLKSHVKKLFIPLCYIDKNLEFKTLEKKKTKGIYIGYIYIYIYIYYIYRGHNMIFESMFFRL